MNANILRAKLKRGLEKALRRGINPYTIHMKYPSGEFWPYTPETRHGVRDYGVIRDNHYHPYDPSMYGYPDEEDIDVHNAHLVDAAYAYGVDPMEVLEDWVTEHERRMYGYRGRNGDGGSYGYPRRGSYSRDRRPYRGPSRW
jgi:hypothetical protein